MVPNCLFLNCGFYYTVFFLYVKRKENSPLQE